MSNQELQEEEREVLQAIYDGDSSFKELNPTTYQYKVYLDKYYLIIYTLFDYNTQKSSLFLVWRG